MTVFYSTFDSPLGELLVASTEKGICAIDFYDGKKSIKEIEALAKRLKAKTENKPGPFFKDAKKQLKEYFARKRTKFDFPLFTEGTDFQKSAWKSLCKIPYGQVRSYQDQAISVGNKKAVRAVASANSRNRIAIVIPCHRVIGKNGHLTGYAGKLWRKERLLQLEGYLEQVEK